MYSLEIKLPQAYVRPYVRLGIKNHSSMQYVACARTINLMINCFWHIESLAACLQLAALLTNDYNKVTRSLFNAWHYPSSSERAKRVSDS